MEITAEQAAQATGLMALAFSDPDIHQAASSVGDEYIRQIENSFAQSVDPDGNAWEPIFYREVPPPPLELSGALHDSAIADAMSANVTKTSYETTGANLVDYAAEQQYGMEYGMKHYVGGAARYARIFKKYITWFPGRPFLGFGQELIEKAKSHGIEEMNIQLLESFKKV